MGDQWVIWMSDLDGWSWDRVLGGSSCHEEADTVESRRAIASGSRVHVRYSHPYGESTRTLDFNVRNPRPYGESACMSVDK